jgi:hypothetical protein
MVRPTSCFLVVLVAVSLTADHRDEPVDRFTKPTCVTGTAIRREPAARERCLVDGSTPSCGITRVIHRQIRCYLAYISVPVQTRRYCPNRRLDVLFGKNLNMLMINQSHVTVLQILAITSVSFVLFAVLWVTKVEEYLEERERQQHENRTQG